MTDSRDPFFSVERRVEFRDTDAAGIVHFSAFFPMMESAEHALLRHVGLQVMHPLEDGTHLTWPRVSASCDYFGAARFEEILTIVPTVIHLGTKSVRYSFDIRRGVDEIARGQFATVCCVLSPAGKLHSVPIPDEIRSALRRAMVA